MSARVGIALIKGGLILSAILAVALIIAATVGVADLAARLLAGLS